MRIDTTGSRIKAAAWAIAVVVGGCLSQAPPQPPQTERTSISQRDCEAQGGTVENDPGDGTTRRPGYVCPSGKRPVGDVTFPEGGPFPVEGAVCCPR